MTADDDELRELVIAFGCYGDTSLISHNNVLSTADISIEHQHYFSFTFHSDIIIRPTTTFSQSLARREISTRSPATAGIANRPLLFLEHRIPMPELFTVRRFTRVLEAGKYGCPY